MGKCYDTYHSFWGGWAYMKGYKYHWSWGRWAYVRWGPHRFQCLFMWILDMTVQSIFERGTSWSGRASRPSASRVSRQCNLGGREGAKLKGCATGIWKRVRAQLLLSIVYFYNDQLFYFSYVVTWFNLLRCCHPEGLQRRVLDATLCRYHPFGGGRGWEGDDDDDDDDDDDGSIQSFSRLELGISSDTRDDYVFKLWENKNDHQAAPQGPSEARSGPPRGGAGRRPNRPGPRSKPLPPKRQQPAAPSPSQAG